METLVAPEHAKTPQENLREYLGEVGLEGATAEQRLEFIEKATPEGFMEFAGEVHRVVAPHTNPEHHSEQMKLKNPEGEVTHMLALPEERGKIITAALAKAQAVARKYRVEGGSIDNALERGGNLMALGLGLAHYWEDGNGKALRATAHVIRFGFDTGDTQKNRDLAFVSASRPTTGFKINSYVPKVEGANENPEAFLDTVAALDVPLDPEAYAQATQGKFSKPYAAGHAY
ncbi:MAG TPA: hypothetical protein VIM53_03320 [Candidatus Saccharimonadales bacterium]